MIESNPAKRVQADLKHEAARVRDRTLSVDEFGRLCEAIDKTEDPHLRACFALLAHTGARKGEILNARWEDLDLEGGTLHLPSTKSGRPQKLWLTPELMALLDTLPRCSEYIIAGRFQDKPRRDIRKPWATLKNEAALPDDIRIHDLRRTFGLQIAQLTGNTAVASRLLRHSSIAVTDRHYTPYADEVLREALEARAKVVP